MKRIFKFYLSLFLLSLFLFRNAFFLKKEREKLERFSSPASYLQKPFIQVTSFGFVDLVEELIFLSLLEDLGSKSFSRFEELKLKEKVLSFSRLSPRIESFYTLSCFVFLFELKKPEVCLEVLNLGVRVLPLSWRLLLTRGYIEAFWFGDYKQAAKFYEEASFLEGAPYFLESFSKSLREGHIFIPEKEKLETLLFEKVGP